MAGAKGNELRYAIFKSEARKIALETVRTNLSLAGAKIDPVKLSFEPICRKAIACCLEWGEAAQHFRWHDVPKWKKKDLKGFDLALWYDGCLYGLCYATPRKSTIRIKIVLLESHPARCHPLRGYVSPLALVPIDVYARMLGLSLIEVQDPDAGAIARYRELGFEYDHEGSLVIPVAGE
jgi:hypothetical protein